MNSFSPFDDDNRPGSSTSGSDDGSLYAVYSDAAKAETDPEDDGSTSLTSQTLNADGTPKRPMNAFMIFARRRRPQVSAENQSMRTGEISKILSKEWNNMPTIEKQFYLDQAKQLKDTFNTKYPDYVYRRRPNNSRKRRRLDIGGSRSTDPSHTSDGGEDVTPLGDLGESSHTTLDAEDAQVDSITLPHDTRPSSSSASFSYGRTPSELGYRQGLSNRTSFTPPDSLAHPLLTGMPPPPRPHSNPNYSYTQTPTQPTVFGDAPWDPAARLRSVASVATNWFPSLHHSNTNQERPSIMTSFTTLKQSYPSASTSTVESTPTSAWPTSGSTDASSNYSTFSSLSSPFYPPHSLSNVTSPGDFTSPTSSLSNQLGRTDIHTYTSMSPPPMPPPPLFPQLHHHRDTGTSHTSSFNAGSVPRSMQAHSTSFPATNLNIPPIESPSPNADIPQISGYWTRTREGH